MGRIRRGWSLAKLSWGVLSRDRSLAIFPIIAAVASLVAIIAIAVPSYVAFGVDEEGTAAYLVGAVIAFVTTFIAIYCNVALVSCAARSFEGHDTQVSEGLAAANARIGVILRWTLLATTVGLLLRALEERLPLAGRIAVWLVGAAWAIATYFVVPVLAFEEVGPVDALKRSASIVKRTWGEAVIGNVGISAAVWLASLLVVVPLALLGAFLLGVSVSLAVLVFVLAALALVFGGILASTLTQVYNTALYTFANTGTAPPGFPSGELQAAFRRK